MKPLQVMAIILAVIGVLFAIASLLPHCVLHGSMVSEFERFDALEGIPGIPGIHELPPNASAKDLLVVLQEASMQPCLAEIKVDWWLFDEGGRKTDHSSVLIDAVVLSTVSFATRYDPQLQGGEHLALVSEDFVHQGMLWGIFPSGLNRRALSVQPWTEDGVPLGIPPRSLLLTPSSMVNPLAQIHDFAMRSSATLEKESGAWVLTLALTEEATEFFDPEEEPTTTPVRIGFSPAHGGPIWVRWYRQGKLVTEIEVLRFEMLEGIEEALFAFTPSEEDHILSDTRGQD